MGVTHLEAVIHSTRLITGNATASAADMIPMMQIVTKKSTTGIMIEEHGIQARPAKKRISIIRGTDLMTGIDLMQTSEAVRPTDITRVMMTGTDIEIAGRETNMTSRKGEAASCVV